VKFIELTVYKQSGNIFKGDKLRININDIIYYRKANYTKEYKDTSGNFTIDDFFESLKNATSKKDIKIKTYQIEVGVIKLKNYIRSEEIEVYEKYEDIKKMIEGD
jgi:hypothetical protein